jgi:hypothetical protein
MARMHPEDIEGMEKTTEGEKKLFRFLRETARPDSEFIGWYEPTIGPSGSEPDFVLFGNSLGLLVLEVKDWVIDQIEEADSHHFEIWIGGREENETNPDRQVKISLIMTYLAPFDLFEHESDCTTDWRIFEKREFL